MLKVFLVIIKREKEANKILKGNKMIRKKSTNGKRHLKDHLLRSFLVISIIFSVFLISNCDDLFNHIPLFPGGGGNSRPPEFGGDESESYITTLFKSVAEGAAGEIGSSSVGWAFSALGLSDESGPDYSDQFHKIDQDLQEISNQLNKISGQLSDIYNELKVINCTLWSTNSDLGMAQSSIVGRMVDFQNLMGQALDTTSPGNRLDINDMRDWVTSVLGDSGAVPAGNVAIQTAMENLEIYLPGGPNGGVIPACVQAILAPDDNTFGTDTVYYNQVKLLLNYFYGYQVEALYLYSEAMHLPVLLTRIIILLILFPLFAQHLQDIHKNAGM